MEVNANEKLVVTASQDQTARIYSLQDTTLTPLRKLSFAPLHCQLPYNFAFASFTRSGQLVTVSNPRQGGAFLTVWEGPEMSQVRSQKVSSDPVSAAGLSPDSRHFAIGTIEGDCNIILLE